MFSFSDAVRDLKLPLFAPKPWLAATGASIDSRTLRPGNLFVALRGENTDGHLFLKTAFEKGAAGALCEEGFFLKNRKSLLDPDAGFRNLIPTADPRKTFADLASWYRSRFHIPFIGLTGSVGKTSTKEFLHYLLRQKMQVLANEGNYNNLLGLSLTLFRLRPSFQLGLAELGANHRGEILELARILKPRLGIITQVSPAHLEGFGDLDSIYEAKLELVDALLPKSPVIIPSEDLVLKDRVLAKGHPVIRVGETPDADYRVTRIRFERSSVHFEVNGKPFAFPGLATFLARNAAMALAASEVLNFPLSDMPSVWKDLVLPEGRFQEYRFRDDIRVIYDGYNANPLSFERALEAFRALPVRGKRLLVFADMLELGSREGAFHEALGRAISRHPFDFVAAYGPRSKASIETIRREKDSAEAEHFDHPVDIVQAISRRIQPHDAILLKASRGMKIEQVLWLLEEQLSVASLADGE